jgi:hypothetical protein
VLGHWRQRSFISSAHVKKINEFNVEASFHDSKNR